MEDISIALRNGLSVRAKSWGSQHDKKLLALHGWLDNAASFDGLAPTLAQKYHVVALDLPGHGQSDHRSNDADYLFVEWLHDIDCIVDALGWDTWTQVGHSMGAAISLFLTGTFPDKIEQLVLLEGLGPLTNTSADAPELMRRGLRSRRMLQDKPQRVVTSLEEGVERMLKARMPMAQSSAMAIARRGTNAVEGGFMFSHDPRLHGTSVLRLTEEHVAAFLSEIKCPMLLIRANEGWPAPPELIARRRAQLGALCTIVDVPGGHHVHMDTPGVVLPPLRSFLNITKPSGH